MVKDSSHRILMAGVVGRRHRVFLAAFNRTRFMLAAKDDIHKSLDEFKIRPDPTTNYGVSFIVRHIFDFPRKRRCL